MNERTNERINATRQDVQAQAVGSSEGGEGGGGITEKCEPDFEQVTWSLATGTATDVRTVPRRHRDDFHAQRERLGATLRCTASGSVPLSRARTMCAVRITVKPLRLLRRCRFVAPC